MGDKVKRQQDSSGAGAPPPRGDRMGPVEIEMEELANRIEYDQGQPGAHDEAAADESELGPAAKRGRHK